MYSRRKEAMNSLLSKKGDLEDRAAEIRTKVADTLESAAQSVRAAADEGASALSDFADHASKKLDNGAASIRSFARRKTRRSLRDKVRANPMRSLAVVVAVGLVAGITWRSAR
jgi:ElaB/YqjD/DUF883 family membrane-anchored ribosome-binding protein